MDDVFSTATTVEDQPTPADLSRQFDASAEIARRAASRYGYAGAADADQQWALERARTGVDRITRARRSRDAFTQSVASGSVPSANGNLNGGGSGGRGSSGGGSDVLSGGRKPALYDPSRALSNQREPGVRTRTNPGGTSFAGIMQLLGPLLGSENMAALNRQGVLGLLRDGYRDPTMSGNGRSAASRAGTQGALGGVGSRVDLTAGNRDYQTANSYQTEDGNTAIVGEDGVMRIVSPQGVIVEQYARGAWNYDADGNLSYGEDTPYGDAGDDTGDAGNFSGTGFDGSSGGFPTYIPPDEYTPPPDDFFDPNEGGDWGSGDFT
jgi:hypothetical protein